MSVNEFSKYNAFLSDRLKLDMEQLEVLRKEFEKSPLHEPSNLPKKTPDARASSQGGKCTYLLKSGKNKGQPCGAKESIAESCRCKTHAGKDLDEHEKSSSASTKSSGDDKKEFAKSTSKADAPEVEDKKKEPVKTTKSKKGQDLKEIEQKEVIKIIEQRRNDVPIIKSKFGNYTHVGTSLVWERDTMCVVGREMPNGTVLPLSENDIQLCVANSWKYKSEMKVNTEAREVDHPELYESDVSDSDSDDN
jgi:hypothetical protein